MSFEEIIKKLKSLENLKDVLGMARFGITPKTKVLGISIYELRKIKKDILNDPEFADPQKRHKLAHKLWSTKIHEARILASFIEAPELVTKIQLEKWVKDFDSWVIVDQVSGLIAHTPFVF